MLHNTLPDNNQIKVGHGHLSLSSDYLILLLELGVELGLKHSELLSGSQLEASILMSPGISVGHQSFLTVVANFRKHQPDLSFAIVYGKRMTLSKHGALGIAARHSRTTQEAAEAVAAYMSTRAEIFTIRRERDNHSRRLYVEPEIAPSEDIYFLVLAYLTSIEFIIRQMLSYNGAIATRIELPISPTLWQGETLNQKVVELDKDAEGAQVCFSAPLCMLYWPTEILEELLPSFDKDLVSMAQQVCEGELKSKVISHTSTMIQAVASEFMQARCNLPTVEGVASKLNVSPATLKRKLKAEGQSFREIKDEVLYSRAIKNLADKQQSIESIAEQLGYSDASNFAKAFKSWSGMSPSDYRLSNLDSKVDKR